MNKMFVLPMKEAFVSRRFEGDYSGSTHLLVYFAVVTIVVALTTWGIFPQDWRFWEGPSKAITLAQWQQ